MFYLKNLMGGQVIPRPTTTVAVVRSTGRPFLVLLLLQVIPVSRFLTSPFRDDGLPPSLSAPAEARLPFAHSSCAASLRYQVPCRLSREPAPATAVIHGTRRRERAEIPRCSRSASAPFARSSRSAPSRRRRAAGHHAVRHAAAIVIVVVDRGGLRSAPRALPSPLRRRDVATSRRPVAVARGSRPRPRSRPPPRPLPLPPCAAVDVCIVRDLRTARRGAAPSRGSIPPSAQARPRDDESFRRGRHTNAFSIAATPSVAAVPSVTGPDTSSLVALLGQVGCDLGHVRGAEPEARLPSEPAPLWGALVRSLV